MRELCWVTLFSALVIGCTDGSSESEEGIGADAHGLIGTAPERSVFVIGAVDDPTRLDAIIDEVESDWSWVKVEVPSTTQDGMPIDLSGPASFDLTDASVAVTFAQRYIDSCDPSSDDQRACWLTEHYVAGEDGLEGSIRIERPDGGLAITYYVDWQGITDRFEGEPQWHRHISGEVAAVAAENLVETSL